MAHEAHHDAHHSLENKPKTALNSSFWFVLILALLFISAVNFVKVYSGGEHEGHGEAHQTEHVEHEAGAAAEHAEHEHATHEEEAHGEAEADTHTEETHH